MARARRRFVIAGSLATVAGPAAASGGAVSTSAIAMFLALIAVTLVATALAARRTRTRGDFYVAHGRITPLQNGLAISGEFISAGTLLGYTALFYAAGVDAFIYVVGALAALSLILFVVGERLRRLGRFTFADVCALRFRERPIRTVAAANTIVVLLLMMVGQLVGAGALTEILFGIPYTWAVLLSSALMMVYVMFGGMYATTWVQIIKASLLLLGGTIIGVLVLSKFGFSADRLLSAAVRASPRGAELLGPGALIRSPADAASLALTLAFGSAGLPHLLMRFFTVRDGAAASRSIFYSLLLMAYIYLLLAVFGFGAAALLAQEPSVMEPTGRLRGGDNMALLHLSSILGGPLLFGAMSAIVFATSVAVISGLSLSAAATVSHDIYARILRRGAVPGERREMFVSRLAVAGFTVLATVIALASRDQNIIFMVALGVSIAASSNCPILIASMYWRGATTRGIVAAGATGFFACVLLIVASPTIWVGILGYAQPLFPYQYPTIVALPLAVFTLVAVSLLDRSEDGKRSRLSYDSRIRAVLQEPDGS